MNKSNDIAFSNTLYFLGTKMFLLFLTMDAWFERNEQQLETKKFQPMNHTVLKQLFSIYQVLKTYDEIKEIPQFHNFESLITILLDMRDQLQLDPMSYMEMDRKSIRETMEEIRNELELCLYNVYHIRIQEFITKENEIDSERWNHYYELYRMLIVFPSSFRVRMKKDITGLRKEIQETYTQYSNIQHMIYNWSHKSLPRRPWTSKRLMNFLTEIDSIFEWIEFQRAQFSNSLVDCDDSFTHETIFHILVAQDTLFGSNSFYLAWLHYKEEIWSEIAVWKSSPQEIPCLPYSIASLVQQVSYLTHQAMDFYEKGITRVNTFYHIMAKYQEDNAWGILDEIYRFYQICLTDPIIKERADHEDKDII